MQSVLRSVCQIVVGNKNKINFFIDIRPKILRQSLYFLKQDVTTDWCIHTKFCRMFYTVFFHFPTKSFKFALQRFKMAFIKTCIAEYLKTRWFHKMLKDSPDMDKIIIHSNWLEHRRAYHDFYNYIWKSSTNNTIQIYKTKVTFSTCCLKANNLFQSSSPYKSKEEKKLK